MDRGWTFAFQGVNFLALVWLLQRFLYRPVQRTIAERQRRAEQAAAQIREAQGSVDQARAAIDHERVLLGDGAGITAGTRVTSTGSVARVPVGDGLLGRIVDPLGRPLDGGPPIAAARHDPVHRPAPPILDRDFVTGRC